MRKFALLAAAAAAILSAAGAAQANTVTLQETLDISQPQNGAGNGFGGWRNFTADGGAFSPSYSFDLSAGDSVDMTVDFVGAQTVTLTNPTLFWLFNYVGPGQDASDVVATGSLQLLDTNGAVLFTSNVVTDTEGEAHFGQYFNNTDFVGLPSSVTFGGLRYQGTLDSYFQNPTNKDQTVAVTTRTYNDPSFLFEDATTAAASAAPEPASWALMILGFGGAGAMLRRRSLSLV